MTEHDLEKLLGGFGADTLTAEERKLLYTAALQDQQLFNALADEQALKELLADPAVRRRLLQALNQPSLPGAGGSLSWLDWFRRPASLAFAGGLAVAVFAVVLGTKVYQDSLKQAAQPVLTENTPPAALPAPVPSTSQPAPPHVAEPQSKAKDNVLADKMAKRERSAPPALREQRPPDSARDSARRRSEQDEIRKQTESPVAAQGKTAEETTAAADQKLAASSPPPAAAPTPTPMQAPASAPTIDTNAPTVGARTLFYGESATRPNARAMAQEKERAMTPLAETAPQANRPERKLDRFAAGKATDAVIQPKALGLRYSFVVRATDGLEREADAATVAKSTGLARLTVEANQDAYLQIWKTVASSTPQLLFPDKDSGQISVKILAGQRHQIPLPPEIGTVTLTARLSRVPFGPITRQEATMLDRPSPHQLQESIGGATGSQEQATYVVNQDSSATAQLSVEIPLSLH